MLRGLYTAASGMLGEGQRLDVVANNLANASTVGYKRDQAVFRAFPEILLYRINDTPVTLPNGRPLPSLPQRPPVVGRLGTGVWVEQVVTNLSPGPLRFTGNTFDLAVVGPAYFAVQTPQGIAYTRDGAFQRNAAGILVNTSGYPVLGVNGPVQVGGKEITFSEDGGVYLDGVRRDTLRLTVFTNPGALRKQGENLFTAGAGAGPQPASAGVTVKQGFLEQANVNVVREMVEMITVTRAYEANQKVIAAQDELLGKAVNEVGRI